MGTEALDEMDKVPYEKQIILEEEDTKSNMNEGVEKIQIEDENIALKEDAMSKEEEAKILQIRVVDNMTSIVNKEGQDLETNDIIYIEEKLVDTESQLKSDFVEEAAQVETMKEDVTEINVIKDVELIGEILDNDIKPETAIVQSDTLLNIDTIK